MPSSIVSPFPFFTDASGAPLEAGYIYIGQSNLNPETAPVNVFWDLALTIPAGQPIRTVGGYPSRAGSPSRFYVSNDTYSITVRNRNHALVFSAFDQSDAPTSVFDVSTQVITATAGQTTFALTTFTYLPGTDTLQVYRNGLRLTNVTDYIETNGNTVTLTAPAAAGDQFLFQGGAVITGDQTPGTSVSFIQAGTGAVTRNIQDKARESVSVLDFGADPTGTTDSRLNIQAAIDSLGAAGGTVEIPAGVFLISSAFTISNSNIRIVGAGAATVLRHTDADSRTFRIIADVDFWEVSNLKIDHSVVATSGFVFQTEVSGILGGLVSSVVTIGAYGIAKNTISTPNTSVNNISFSDCFFLQTVRYGLWLQFTVDWSTNNCIFEMASQNTGVTGLIIESSNDGFYSSKTLYLGGEKGAVAQNLIPLGVASRHFFFETTAFDGAKVNAFEITALRRSRFVACWFASVYSTCNGVAINGASAYALLFSSCIFLNLAGNGMLIQGGATDIDVLGNQFIDWGVAAAATYAAIITAANAGTRFTISNNRFLNDSDFIGNPWRGIVVNAGAYDTYSIIGNTASGLTGEAIVDAGTSSTARVVSNIGYNPVGQSAFTAGASPYTYTAGHSDETVYIRGGTVSSIVQGAMTLFSSTDKSVHLGPNESIVITHSSAPILSVQKH